MRFALATAVLFAAILPSAPALAQDTGGDKVNQLIVYGQDPCPVPTGDEITVCARKAESERYRIPDMFRGSESPANEAWSSRVQSYELVGRTGALSCSAVGPGGSTGCLEKMINKAYAEKKLAPDVRFAELIAAEREKRLGGIDQRSAEEQARVEALEKQYEDKRKAEEATASSQPTADEPVLPPPPKN
jgi:hypothetical protein